MTLETDPDSAKAEVNIKNIKLWLKKMFWDKLKKKKRALINTTDPYKMTNLSKECDREAYQQVEVLYIVLITCYV